MKLALGFRIFCKNILLNLILVVQLAFCLLASNALLGLYNQEAVKLNAVRGFDSGRVLLYMQNQDDGTAEEKQAVLNGRLRGLPQIEAAEKIYGMPLLWGEDYVPVLAYGPRTAEGLSLPLQSGRWFTQAKKQEGVINCVLYSPNPPPVGTVLTLGDVDGSGGATGSQRRFCVTGTIGTQGLYADFTGCSNDASLDVLFQRYRSTAKEEPAPMILCAQADWAGALVPNGTENTLLFLQKGLSAQEREAVVTTLKSNAWVTPLDRAKANTREDVNAQLRVMLPLVIGLFLIGGVGLIGLTILNTLRSLRVFTVYYVCGMRWGDSVKICVGYLACIFLGILLLAGLIWGWLGASGTLNSFGILLQADNAALTAAFLAAAGLTSLAAPCLLVRGESPARLLRET